MDWMNELQEKMLRYRAEHNISQTELAHRCNLTLMTINAVENGRQTPSKLTERKIRLVVDEKK